MDKLYEIISKELSKKVSNVIEASVCVDIWTEKVNSNSYLGVTATYIDETEYIENFKSVPFIKLNNITCGVSLMEGKKEHNYCHNLTFEMLNLMFKPSTNFSFTTDKGGNLVKAFNS